MLQVESVIIGFTLGWIVKSLFRSAQSIIGSSGSLVHVQGNISSVTVNGKHFSSPTAHALKVIAVDKNGAELENYVISKGPIQIFISGGNFKEVRASQGTIVVEKAEGDIGNVSTSQGSIRIVSAGNIDTVKTSQGSISIENCESVGHTQTSQGKIDVRQRSPVR